MASPPSRTTSGARRNRRGTYTQDFVLLGEDAAAAVKAARRSCFKCFSRVGLFGRSQGGWVAPLAATRTAVDFLGVGFGVVGTPVEQRIYGRDGLPLSRSTVCEWHLQLADLVQPLINALREDALTAPYLCTDATGVLVQADKKYRTVHFFVVAVPDRHVLFGYSPKHDSAAVDELLKEAIKARWSRMRTPSTTTLRGR
jgi:hypothetical protein